MDINQLQSMLADAAEISSERQEKASESHMIATFMRDSGSPVSADAFQAAADYALKTSQILCHYPDLVRKTIAAEKLAEALRFARAGWADHLEEGDPVPDWLDVAKEALAAWDAAQ